jgi:hypothetical protein
MGAPLRCLLHVPSLDRNLEVVFLVDTGAEMTAISSADLGDLGKDALAQIPTVPHSVPLTSPGGIVQSSLTRVSLGLIHDEGQVTVVSMPVALLDAPNVPSLLGRDILSMGRLTIDGPAGTASLDIPPGAFRLPDRP